MLSRFGLGDGISRGRPCNGSYFSRKQFGLLKSKHNNLRIRAQAQRRSPRACTARGEDLHFPESGQAIDEFPVDASRYPAPGYKLTEVSMSGELQRNAGGLGNLRVIRRMSQQNACPITIQADSVKHRGKSVAMGCVPIWDADDLQAIHFHLLIAEDANTGSRNGIQILSVVPELLVVSCHKIHSLWRRKFFQWLCRLMGIDGCAIV